MKNQLPLLKVVKASLSKISCKEWLGLGSDQAIASGRLLRPEHGVRGLGTDGSRRSSPASGPSGSCRRPWTCRSPPAWTPPPPSRAACPGSRPSTASSRSLASSGSTAVSRASGSVCTHTKGFVRFCFSD